MLFSKKTIWIALSALIAIVIGLSVWLWVIRYVGQNANDSKSDQDGPSSVIEQGTLDQITALREQGKYDEAQKLIDAQNNTDDSFNVVLRAQVQAEKGDIDSALKLLLDAEQNSNRAYWYRGHAAKILYDASKFDEAKQYYQEAIEMASSTQPANEDEELIITSNIAEYRMDLADIEAADR